MARGVSVTLIRHLPTNGNREHRYIGWTDEAIADVGTVDWRFRWEPGTVYGSDLRRARESAALYFPKAEYKADFRFRENHFGEWEGKTYEVLKDNDTYRDWIDDPYGRKPPGGESLAITEKRVLSAFMALPSEEKDYFVVTHGGPIRILLTRFSPEPQDFWSWRIPHGSAWRLEWQEWQKCKEGERCVSLSAVPLTANGSM